jgi:hypothetical protein
LAGGACISTARVEMGFLAPEALVLAAALRASAEFIFVVKLLFRVHAGP